MKININEAVRILSKKNLEKGKIFPKVQEKVNFFLKLRLFYLIDLIHD